RPRSTASPRVRRLRRRFPRKLLLLSPPTPMTTAPWLPNRLGQSSFVGGGDAAVGLRVGRSERPIALVGFSGNRRRTVPGLSSWGGAGGVEGSHRGSPGFEPPAQTPPRSRP